MADNVKRPATCDECGEELGCLEGDPRLKGYWQLEIGVRYCDPCLLQHSDDHMAREETERLFSLRLRYVRGINVEAIEAKAKEARALIIPEQANRPLSELQQALKLFRAGERLAAMEAGQAAWNTANSLHIAVATHADVVAGQRAADDRKRGAAAKLAKDPKQAAKNEALRLWRDWQAGRTIHKSQAAFARFVVDALPVLADPATVENWCRQWRATDGGTRSAS